MIRINFVNDLKETDPSSKALTKGVSSKSFKKIVNKSLSINRYLRDPVDIIFKNPLQYGFILVLIIATNFKISNLMFLYF